MKKGFVSYQKVHYDSQSTIIFTLFYSFSKQNDYSELSRFHQLRFIVATAQATAHVVLNKVVCCCNSTPIDRSGQKLKKKEVVYAIEHHSNSLLVQTHAYIYGYGKELFNSHAHTHTHKRSSSPYFSSNIINSEQYMHSKEKVYNKFPVSKSSISVCWYKKILGTHRCCPIKL